MTPLAENALLVIVSVSVAGPAWEYVTVIVQLPPGAIDPEQVLVCEKALLDPLPNVSPEIVRFKLPVLVSVVVCDELSVVNLSAPLLTINSVTLVFRSLTKMLPEPSRVIPVGLLSPVSGTWVVGAVAECAAGTMRTRWLLSVMNISPLGSKAMPAGELSAHVVTVAAQGEIATGEAPVPLSATCRIWLRFPSPT